MDHSAIEVKQTMDHSAMELKRTMDHSAMEVKQTTDHSAMEVKRTMNHGAMGFAAEGVVKLVISELRCRGNSDLIPSFCFLLCFSLSLPLSYIMNERASYQLLQRSRSLSLSLSPSVFLFCLLE